MKPTVSRLLNQLPAYRDQWITIADDQTTEDIIEEVLAAHLEYAPLYDKISSFFNQGSTRDICENLYQFCKQNLDYREETESHQSTLTPQGLLTRGYCDCKGYAGFVGGVLDGLNRQGKKIKWKYRFASYRPLDDTPHHVFIVVDNAGNEVWVDPTPAAVGQQPYWYQDKKISSITNNNSGMSLNRNIAGIVDHDALAVSQGGFESFEIPAGADLTFVNGEWKVTLPHKIAGYKIGQTDPISTGLSLIANITSLFKSGGSSSAAAQKIFQMFPLPAVPTVQNMTDLINAIVLHENGDAGLDSQWVAAFADIRRQYNNLLAALQAGTTIPSIVVPAQGQPAFTTLPPSVTPIAPGALTQPGVTSTSLQGLLIPGIIIVAAYFLLKKKRA